MKCIICMRIFSLNIRIYISIQVKYKLKIIFKAYKKSLQLFYNLKIIK